MFCIGNNCCTGYLYHKLHIPFNNPFVWMVLPNKSVYNLLSNFYHINWSNISMRKSNIKPNTYIITVDDIIDIHYVHYHLNPMAAKLTCIKSANRLQNHLEWKYIYKYIVEKYFERVKRMVMLKEPPCFLIDEETYITDSISLSDIALVDSPFKRYIISTQKITVDNELVFNNVINRKMLPIDVVDTHINSIMSFIGA